MQFTKMSYSIISLNGPPHLVSLMSHFAMFDLSKNITKKELVYRPDFPVNTLRATKFSHSQ